MRGQMMNDRGRAVGLGAKVLFVEALHGVPVWVGAPVALVALLLTGSQQRVGAPVNDLLWLGSGTVVVVAPLLAGAAVVLTQRRCARGWSAWGAASPRGAAGVVLMGASALVLWGVIACAGGIAVLLVQGASGDPTPAGLLPPLVAVLVVAVSVLLGTGIGARSSTILAAPAVAISLYAIPNVAYFAGVRLRSEVGAAASVASLLRWFDPVPLELRLTTVTEPNPWRWLVVAGLLFGVAATAALSVAHRKAALVAFVMTAASTALALTVADPEPIRYRATPTESPCGSAVVRSGTGSVTVCVWPQQSDDLEPLLLAVARLYDAATPVLPDVPATFVQIGLRPERVAGLQSQVGDVGVLEGLGPFDTNANPASDPVLNSLVPPPPCDRVIESLDEHNKINNLVAYRGSGQTEPRDDPELARVLALDDAAQRQWVREQLREAEALCG